jgi:HlyD family secretion protein
VRAFPLLALLPALASCDRPLVQVVPVERGTVETTVTSIEAGLVRSRHDSSLSPPVSGRIVEVLRREGERVKTGEALIRLENDLERIAVEEARVELERLKGLPPGAAARELVDRARFALERAQVHYERTFVRAPFDGLLVELNASLGEMSYGTLPLNMVLGGPAGAGAPEKALARVVDDSALYVEAEVDEADAGRLKPGQAARVSLEALEGQVLPGRLARVAPAVTTAEGRSRTVTVEIELVAPSPASSDGAWPSGLLVGMSADIEVIVERVEGVLHVPTLTVLEGEGGASVFVVEEGKLRRRFIQTGASNWDRTEVRGGLHEGERAVIPIDRRELVEGREVRTELRPREGREARSGR